MTTVVRGVDEDSQKDMSSSYKINKYWACDVLYDKYNIMAAHYMKSKRVSSSSNPKGKHHFLFFNVGAIYRR